MFLHLKQLLSRRLSEQGLLKQTVAAQVIQATRKFVADRWGQASLELVTEAFLKQDTLQLRVSSSAFAQELKLAETELVAELQNNFPGQVKRLRVSG